MFVHPMPHIVGRGCHQGIDGIPKGALEVVPHHPVVGFQVADNRLDSRTFAELLPVKLRIRRERDVLQQHHPNHLPDWNARTAVVRAVVLRELRLHRLPVYLLGQKDQFMVHVDETFQCYFEDGHLMLLGCFTNHFASIICRFPTSI